MTYHQVCNKSKTTGTTVGAGIAYSSGAPEITLSFSEVGLAQSLVFCVVFCKSFVCSFVLFILATVLFVLFILATVLFVLFQFMASDKPFGIFNLSLYLQSCLSSAYMLDY